MYVNIKAENTCTQIQTLNQCNDSKENQFYFSRKLLNHASIPELIKADFMIYIFIIY